MELIFKHMTVVFAVIGNVYLITFLSGNPKLLLMLTMMTITVSLIFIVLGVVVCWLDSRSRKEGV